MDARMIAAYDRPVPRYTSYPTAAQFGPSVGPADHAAWLADLDAWVGSLRDIARRYIEGDAPAQPAPDVCRHCHLTVLCRRVELAENPLEEFPGE